MSQITANTSVAEIVKLCPGARRIFDEHGLKGCGGEHGPTEPLGFFAAVHQANLDELLREINAEMEKPSARPYVYKESLQDYIYRRFFKAGIAIVLTVGCLWGAINLLQIWVGQELPAITSPVLDPCPRPCHDLRLGRDVCHGFRLPVIPTL